MAEKAYLVVEMQKQTDGSLAFLVDSYTDRQTAEQKYHTILSYAAVGTLPLYTAVILSEEGTVIKKEFYKHSTEEE